MERIDFTAFPVHEYAHRIAAGQLAARASSASAALAASAAPALFSLAMLGRRTTPSSTGARLQPAA